MNKKLLAALLLVCLAVSLCFAACQPTDEEKPQEVVLSEIKVTTQPTKTTYVVGEKFDKTGMVVTAVYSDKTEKAVTNYTFAPTDELGVSDKEIVVTYTEKSVTKSASVAITVVEATPDALDAPVVALGEDSISWGAVKDATAYEVYVDGTLVDTVTTTEYALDLASGSYEITVKAIFVKGDKKVTSEASNTVNYIYNSQLGAPLLAIDNNVVTWQAVEKADKYVVYVNDEEKQTVTETSYTVAETDIGVYKIAVVAKDSTGKRTDSDKSNVVSYIVKVDLTKAIAVVNNKKVLSLNASRPFVEADNDYTASTNETSLLAEAVGDNYALRTFDGRYLVYVPASSVMENRTWMFADKLQADNQNFIWKLTLSEGTANEYTISSVGAGVDNALAVVEGNVIVDMLSTPTTNAEQRKFVINQSATSVEDFADAQYAVSEPFDITKPFVAQYNTLKSQNYYLGLLDGSKAEAKLDWFVSERTSFSKYADLENAGKCVFMFEKATDFATFKAATYDGDGTDLYRIRTYGGMYLGAAKDNYTSFGGGDTVSAVQFDSQNLWLIWRVEVVGEGQVRLRNLAHDWDWNRTNEYLCNRNFSMTETGFYPLNDNTDYFTLTLTNVDVEMKPLQKLSDKLAGKKVTIANFKTKQVMSLGANNTLKCNDTDAAVEFTLQHVAIEGEDNAYRLVTNDGKVIAYDNWYRMYATDLIDDVNDNYGKGQIWIILPVVGPQEAYTIGPWWCGRDNHGDNNPVYRTLILDDGIHGELDDGTIYSEFGKNDLRNYTERIWTFTYVSTTEAE
mgnify:CR=1 FL=1